MQRSLIVALALLAVTDAKIHAFEVKATIISPLESRPWARTFLLNRDPGLGTLGYRISPHSGLP